MYGTCTFIQISDEIILGTVCSNDSGAGFETGFNVVQTCRGHASTSHQLISGSDVLSSQFLNIKKDKTGRVFFIICSIRKMSLGL
jgi:hypothetical protein